LNQIARASGERAGFTLVELAITVTVIGILASIAIPNYARVRGRAERASCLCNQRGSTSACALYVADHLIQDDVLTSGALFEEGYLPDCLTRCPMDPGAGHDGYSFVIEGGEMTGVTCELLGEEHLWEP